MSKIKKHCVVSLSGGMDSSTLLLRALKEYNTVTAISFYYGQKHKVELERAQSLVDYINNEVKSSIQIHGDSFPGVNYRQIKLDGLSDLLDSALVEGGGDVPEGHYENDNMKETVVPNRNKIFASITQAVALSISNRTGETCDIALGIHAGDHAVYPDCRQEFRDADDKAFREGNWDADRVDYFTPYLETDKLGILKDGQELVKELGLDFDEVYSRTNTSYKPICLANDNTTELYDQDTFAPKYPFTWFSDYKSASSVERIEAFINLGRKDPVAYADETGPVAYEIAKAHVIELLRKHESVAELGRD
tara:strand:+ start:1290 stop:2210 length:921 start_codon:yes stop_codon:yes gene_type:complete